MQGGKEGISSSSTKKRDITFRQFQKGGKERKKKREGTRIW